jgi:EmrB/QacA subfamily drug resistance transporter
MSTNQHTERLGVPTLGRGERTTAQRVPALPVVLAGMFMVVLDFFIVNVALPALQGDLAAGTGALQWIVAGYALTSAVFLITAGRLGDRIGRRRAFSLGLGVFTAASAACGLAPSAAILVAARLAQGLGAAILTPNVLAIIAVTYAGEARARAIRTYGVTLGVGALSGQLIGGLLLRADVLGLGWRACFLVNVPIGLVALALTPAAVAESRAERPGGLDLAGAALLTAALTAALVPLVDGRQAGWPAWAIASLAASPVLLAVFALHQRRVAARGGAPLLAPTLFASRAFSAGLVTQLAFWGGQASYFLVLAIYLQEGMGLSPLQSGVVFTTLAVTYVTASMGAPALAPRYGRRLLAAGALTLATAHGLLLAVVVDVGEHGSVAWLLPGLLLAGLGMGLMIAPLTTIILGAASPAHAGAVSGALSTMQNVGNALGVAVTGVLFFGGLDHGYDHAFAVALCELGLLLVGVAALTRLLPRGTASAG